jgi:hypothetical protein
MKKSNIFAYIELSKLVEELKQTTSGEKLKEKLKTQSAYFSIIETRYFSDSLISEWESILSLTRQKGARVDEAGNVISNATLNSIDSLTLTECQTLANQLHAIFEKVEKEFQ